MKYSALPIPNLWYPVCFLHEPNTKFIATFFRKVFALSNNKIMAKLTVKEIIFLTYFSFSLPLAQITQTKIVFYITGIQLVT